MGQGVPGGLPPPLLTRRALPGPTRGTSTLRHFDASTRKAPTNTIQAPGSPAQRYGNQDFRNTGSTRPSTAAQSTTGTRSLQHMPEQSTTAARGAGQKGTGHVVHHARAPQRQSQTNDIDTQGEKAVVHPWKGRSLHISSFFCHLHHVTLIQAQHACHFTFAYTVMQNSLHPSSFLHFSLFSCDAPCAACAAFSPNSASLLAFHVLHSSKTSCENKTVSAS